MGACALVIIILLLLLVLPCRRRHRSGEITDESSLVRHRIKWLRGNRLPNSVNGQVTTEQSLSAVEEKGVRLSLHRPETLRSNILTDSRLHSPVWPLEVDTDTSTASWKENLPNKDSRKNSYMKHLWLLWFPVWSYVLFLLNKQGHWRRHTSSFEKRKVAISAALNAHVAMRHVSVSIAGKTFKCSLRNHSNSVQVILL